MHHAKGFWFQNSKPTSKGVLVFKQKLFQVSPLFAKEKEFHFKRENYFKSVVSKTVVWRKIVSRTGLPNCLPKSLFT
jgi:hypothetical protein